MTVPANVLIRGSTDDKVSHVPKYVFLSPCFYKYIVWSEDLSPNASQDLLDFRTMQCVHEYLINQHKK